MTWFSDKLGKKFIFNPFGTRPVSFLGRKGKPVKVIGFHGEPDHNLCYYTVQDAEGNLFRAYETELGDEVSNPISKDELAIANAEMIKKLNSYLSDMVDSLEANSPSDYVRGYRRSLENTLAFLKRLEAIRDGVMTEEQAARDIEEDMPDTYSYR